MDVDAVTRRGRHGDQPDHRVLSIAMGSLMMVRPAAISTEGALQECPAGDHLGDDFKRVPEREDVKPYNHGRVIVMNPPYIAGYPRMSVMVNYLHTYDKHDTCTTRARSLDPVLGCDERAARRLALSATCSHPISSENAVKKNYGLDYWCIRDS